MCKSLIKMNTVAQVEKFQDQVSSVKPLGDDANLR